jgi:dTDP-4-amino-4,6-dideoxygalactose transaminase
MANGIYKITDDFEQMLAQYTGAKYAVTLDNMSNALFLGLYYEKNVAKSIKTDTLQSPTEHTHQSLVKLFTLV